jgi:hypothetical protein
MTKPPGNGEEEPGPREQLVEREYQIKRREYDELQRRIAEICRKAAIRERLAEGLCAHVPVPCLHIQRRSQRN